jgi:hypothetical protein
MGRDVELGKLDMVYAVLETSAVLSRVYRRPREGDTVDLLVTYFERGHRGFHPPEVSFVAGGNRIIRSGLVRVTLSDEAGSPPLEANMFSGGDADRTGGLPVLVRYRRPVDGGLSEGVCAVALERHVAAA